MLKSLHPWDSNIIAKTNHPEENSPLNKLITMFAEFAFLKTDDFSNRREKIHLLRHYLHLALFSTPGKMFSAK